MFGRGSSLHLQKRRAHDALLSLGEQPDALFERLGAFMENLLLHRPIVDTRLNPRRER